jgi:basic amino acid/polyamine antiporter, APA family
MSIFRRKTISDVLDHSNKGPELKKTLNALELFMLGLGAILGTGIFVVTGEAAASLAGPAVTISYAIAGITAILIALTYTEIATMIPSSGGAYSYTFVAFGEIFAWMVSWMVILYFLLSVSTIAAGWSGYLVAMLDSGGIHLPIEITRIPSEGGIINLPPMIITLIITMMLIKGTKDSAKLNIILVSVKILAIFLFIYKAAPYFDAVNYLKHNYPYNKDLLLSSPFMPFGLHGVISGATLVFFAYNGFDALASAAEECKNPKRDLIIAILGSLIFCMILYILASGILVGVMPFNLIDQKSSLPSALHYVGHNITASIISAGVIFGMASVILVQTFALSRVILTVARDRLLPSYLTKIHAKYNTPYRIIFILGILISLIAGFIPLSVISTLSSVGALSSFMVVCLALIILRKQYPNANRPFTCPFAYIVGISSIILCLILLTSVMSKVGIYTLLWVILGLTVYFITYKYRMKK